AFEAGRGLAYAVQVDRDFHSRVVVSNPFAADGSAVDQALVRQAQDTIGFNEVAVVLAVMPPRMIAFVISRDRVDYVAKPIATTPADLGKLTDEIKLLPHRLAAGAELRAVPQQLFDFTEEMIKEIGSRSVC